MLPGSLSAFLDALHEWCGQATRSIKLATSIVVFILNSPMASARLEAEDFLVIELCAPYPPRRNTSRHGLYGMIPRLRGPVDETAQTQPAGNAVGCVCAKRMDVGNPGRTMHCTGERARSMAENGAQRKRPSSGLEGRPPGQSNAYICVYACLMCGTKGKVFLATLPPRPFWRAYPRACAKKEPWGR